MTHSSTQHDEKLVPYLSIACHLMLRCSSVQSKESLFFHILNDTRHLIPYDRAYLVVYQEKTIPHIVGISGEEKVNKESPLVIQMNKIIKGLKTPEELHQLSENDIKEDALNAWNQWSSEHDASIFWVPIVINKKLTLGLWLEQWTQESFRLPHQDIIPLMTNYLIPAYGIRWEELKSKSRLASWLGITKKRVFIAASLIFLLLLVVPVPLRIVAPCEVVPSSPYTIRAPLEGVIKEISVAPGDKVKVEDTLFVYEAEAFKEATQAEFNEYVAKKMEENKLMILGLTKKIACKTFH